MSPKKQPSKSASCSGSLTVPELDQSKTAVLRRNPSADSLISPVHWLHFASGNQADSRPPGYRQRRPLSIRFTRRQADGDSRYIRSFRRCLFGHLRRRPSVYACRRAAGTRLTRFMAVVNPPSSDSLGAFCGKMWALKY